MQLLTNTFDSFGLDIGDRSLKVAYVKKRGTDFELKSYGKVDIPEGVFSQGKIIKPDQSGQLIIDPLDMSIVQCFSGGGNRSNDPAPDLHPE